MRNLALALALTLSAVHCSKAPGGAAGSSEGGGPPAAGNALSAAAAALPGALTAALAHPCTLLTTAEVEDALGTKDFTPKENPCKAPVGGGGCTWDVPRGGGFVEIMLPHPSDPVAFDRIAHNLNRVPVSGIGDRAYAEPKYSWGHIDVIKGGQSFTVQVSRGNIATGMKMTPAMLQEKAVALARKVLDRL